MEQKVDTRTEQEGIGIEVLMIYFRKIVKKWWAILLVTLVFGVTGFAVAKLTYQPHYSSQIMFVASNKDSSLIVSGQSSADFSASVSLAQSYQYIFTTTELTTKVANNCGYKVTPEQVKSFVTIKVVEETPIIYFVVTTTDPQVSYAIANTYMRFYEETIADAYPSTTLKAIDPPLLPEAPNADRNTMRYTLIGAAVGLFGSIFLLVAMVMLKDPILRTEDIKQKLGLSVIGNVVHVEQKTKKGEKQSILITDRHSGFAFIEAFKLIRTKLEHTMLRRQKKTLIVTSTMENEGKTTTAINIALALAKNGKDVLLIDGDLRKPAVAKALSINAAEDMGLLGVINGTKTLADSIKYSEKYNLYLLLNGKGIPDPSEMLATAQMEEIVAAAKREFDYVVFDTAPCGLVADASILAAYADSIVMVVRQDTAPMRRIKRALENLDNSGTEVIGCIYNDAKSGFGNGRISRQYGYSYGYGYGNEGRIR